MEIYLKYNPFLNSREIKINGEIRLEKGTYLEKLKGRLQEWIGEFIPAISKEINQKKFKLIFYGREADFEDVREEVELSLKNGYSIDLEFIKSKDAKNIKEKIRIVFEEIQNSDVFELKTDKIKDRFINAMNSEVEVGVIATMSSGKSTLINAMLEEELMPFKNMACTDKITRIKDSDEMAGEKFKARVIGKNNEIIEDWHEISLEKMSLYNDNRDNIVGIEIVGDIPGISSKYMNLVLLDTPGPNNSQKEMHKEHTLNFIKNSELKPLVLYILNATQFAVDDDKNLLTQISTEMKKAGKQSKDRFIFVINKIDCFDPEKEDVSNLLKSVRAYIESFGIENPKVIPVSAELAKVARLEKKGLKLTRAQNKTLNGYDLFLPYEEKHMNMIEFSSLPLYSKKKLNKIAEELLKNGDEKAAAVYYSGMPCLEEAINEYLKKYAFPSKIGEGMESIFKQIEENLKTNELEKSLRNDEKKRGKILEQLNLIQKEINGNNAKEYKEKIKKYHIDTNEIDEIRVEINIIFSKIAKKFESKKVETKVATEIIESSKKTIDDLVLKIKTDAIAKIRDKVLEVAKILLKEYKEHVENNVLIELNKNSYLEEILMVDIPDTYDLIKSARYTEEVITGTSWVSMLIWWQPWTWKDGYYKNNTSTVEYIDTSKLYAEFIAPTRSEISKNINKVEEQLKKELAKIKKIFIDKIEEFENKLKIKVEEMEKVFSNKEEIEKRIEKNRNKIEWINSIKEEIKNILEI